MCRTDGPPAAAPTRRAHVCARARVPHVCPRPARRQRVAGARRQPRRRNLERTVYFLASHAHGPGRTRSTERSKTSQRMIGTALTVLAATVSATPFEGKYFSGVATDPNGTAFLTHLDAARRMFSAGDSELMTFTGVYLPSSEEEFSCHWCGGGGIGISLFCTLFS